MDPDGGASDSADGRVLVLDPVTAYANDSGGPSALGDVVTFGTTLQLFLSGDVVIGLGFSQDEDMHLHLENGLTFTAPRHLDPVLLGRLLSVQLDVGAGTPARSWAQAPADRVVLAAAGVKREKQLEPLGSCFVGLVGEFFKIEQLRPNGLGGWEPERGAVSVPSSDLQALGHAVMGALLGRASTA